MIVFVLFQPSTAWINCWNDALHSWVKRCWWWWLDTAWTNEQMDEWLFLQPVLYDGIFCRAVNTKIFHLTSLIINDLVILMVIQYILEPTVEAPKPMRCRTTIAIGTRDSVKNEQLLILIDWKILYWCSLIDFSNGILMAINFSWAPSSSLSSSATRTITHSLNPDCEITSWLSALLRAFHHQYRPHYWNYRHYWESCCAAMRFTSFVLHTFNNDDGLLYDKHNLRQVWLIEVKWIWN